MNTTTHLARHMLSFQPNKDAARLCLYHYLIHHCERDTPLTPKLFEDFCRMALLHEHWQDNAATLSQELQYILQHYNETFMLDWNLKDYVFPDHWQVVAIKNSIEGIQRTFYLGVYTVFYMIDDMIMVSIAVFSLQKMKLQEKGGRILKLISGVVLILLSIIMFFFPNLLSF